MAIDTQVRPPLTRTLQQVHNVPTAAYIADQIESFTAAGTISAATDLAFADANAGLFILTLPASPDVLIGKPLTVKETDNTNGITLAAAGSGTIDGAATLNIAAGEAATISPQSIDAAGDVTWQITSQTAPNPAAGGELLAANNLSDVASATLSAQNIGALEAANNLSDVASATLAAQNIGALEAANDLSDVASASTARANIVANRKTVTFTRVDLIGATAAVYRYVNASGNSETILRLASGLTGALATGDATITASIDGTPVTTGVITITEVGSAAGDVDSTDPTALNVIAALSVLELTVGGANTAAEFADVSVELTY